MDKKLHKLLKQLENLYPKYIDLSLDRLLILLKKLGNPHLNLPPTIHIAGTNGKGSTLSFIKQILIEHNFNIVKFIDYPDHYKYTYKDIVKIKKIAKNLNAEIITTEKDYSRIELNNDNSLQNNIRFVKMELIIKNEKSLIDLIKKIYEFDKIFYSISINFYFFYNL